MKKNYFKHLYLLFLAVGTSLSAQDYGALLKDHLVANQARHNIALQDVNELEIFNQTTTERNDITYVYAIQKLNGIPVYNGIVNGAFNGTDAVYVANNLQSDIASRANTSAPVQNPIQAAVSAATSLGLGAANFSIEESVSGQEFILSQGGVSLDKVPVKLVYQPLDDNSLRLAWDLSIHALDGKHWWSVRVDAVTGELIDTSDWVVSCTFESHNHNTGNTRVISTTDKEESFGFKQQDINESVLAGEVYDVFALPLESPNHGENTKVVEPQDPVASPFGWHDTDGVEGPEFTITRGNNVYVSDDIDGDNVPGVSPDGGDALSFEFPYLFDTAPVNMLDAVSTNLFYWNNVLHDIMYQYGFDEESGNFQETNYTGAGQGGDFVFADAQDGSGLNNATFGTPGDGGNPRMSMFLWNASGPPGESLTIVGGSLDGSYIGVPATFGAPLPEDVPLEGTLALLEDDNDGGVSTDEIDACDTIINGADLAGNVAVIRRGECEFGFKVLAAENEGAIAVIMVNNVADAPIAMGPGAQGAQVTIPSIMVSQADGEAIIAALQAGEEINISLLNGGPFQLDGSLDNGIIAHEYGHGISNRLTGGPAAAGCLQNAEQMGEGWSDYFGLMLTMKASDTAEQGRGIGTYAIGQPIDGPGIRPAPYSTDTSINGLTYADTNNEGAISQPHGIGTVWATVLWDMTWFLIDEYGFDEDIYNGTGGNNIALQLVIDGLKLQSCSPGFVDGRDGILAAIDINTMIADEDKNTIKCSIWGVFAARGLGVSAVQGSAFNRTDQVEAFDTPSVSDEDSPCFDGSLSTENAVTTAFSIFPNPSNGDINIAVGAPQGEGSVKIIDINGRVVFTQDVTLEGTVRVQAEGLATGIYLLQVQSATATETTKLIIE